MKANLLMVGVWNVTVGSRRNWLGKTRLPKKLEGVVHGPHLNLAPPQGTNVTNSANSTNNTQKKKKLAAAITSRSQSSSALRFLDLNSLTSIGCLLALLGFQKSMLA